MEIAERLSAYDSVAIAQMNAEENGGAYEQKAAELVRRHSSMPIVCAYHLFHDRNVIQRGASALLNARLLPVIDGFLKAVRSSMQLRNLNYPVVIMRSDGSLMNETYALNHPVETLLCGSAASVMAVPTWDIIQSLSSLTWAELPAISHWSKIICLSCAVNGTDWQLAHLCQRSLCRHLRSGR